MKEIQGNSVLVRVSGRFALAKVRVIGSRRLYVHINFVADWKFVLKIRFSSSGFGLIKDTIAFFAQAQLFPICLVNQSVEHYRRVTTDLFFGSTVNGVRQCALIL